MNIIQKPCAAENFRVGRQGHTVDTIVLHIVDGSIAGCDATFASSSLSLRRSAHYCVAKNGDIHQYVEETDTAFHAGRVQQPSVTLKTRSDGVIINPNLYTVGIEHEGRAADEWGETQYDASAALLADIARRYPPLATLTRKNVILHREIFSGKTCPGFKMDVNALLARANRILSVPQAAAAVAAGAGAVGGAAAVPQPAIRPVTILKPVRVRKAPTTTAPVVRVLPASLPPLTPLAIVTGQSINGIATWFGIAADEYIWSGATDAI